MGNEPRVDDDDDNNLFLDTAVSSTVRPGVYTSTTEGEPKTVKITQGE